MYILIKAISLLSLVKGEAELRRHNGQGCTVMTVGDRGVRWEMRGVRCDSKGGGSLEVSYPITWRTDEQVLGKS